MDSSITLDEITQKALFTQKFYNMSRLTAGIERTLMEARSRFGGKLFVSVQVCRYNENYKSKPYVYDSLINDDMSQVIEREVKHSTLITEDKNSLNKTGVRVKTIREVKNKILSKEDVGIKIDYKIKTKEPRVIGYVSENIFDNLPEVRDVSHQKIQNLEKMIVQNRSEFKNIVAINESLRLENTLLKNQLNEVKMPDKLDQYKDSDSSISDFSISSSTYLKFKQMEDNFGKQMSEIHKDLQKKLKNVKELRKKQLKRIELSRNQIIRDIAIETKQLGSDVAAANKPLSRSQMMTIINQPLANDVGDTDYVERDDDGISVGDEYYYDLSFNDD